MSITDTWRTDLPESILPYSPAEGPICEGKGVYAQHQIKYLANSIWTKPSYVEFLVLYLYKNNKLRKNLIT